MISLVQGQCWKRAEDPASACGDELGCCGEQAESQAAGFAEPGLAGQGEHGHPGQQVEGDLDDLKPDIVLGCGVQGQVAQAGGSGGPDAASARARSR